MSLRLAPFVVLFALTLNSQASRGKLTQIPGRHRAVGLSLPLRDNWQIQDSKEVKATGAAISVESFQATGWIPATVPSTVLGALITAGDVKVDDPFFGKDLLKLPGTGPYYIPGKNFNSTPTPKSSPFGRPWWYRTTFTLPDSADNQRVDLQFNGVTYGMDIWLNGHLIATSADTAGTYRTPRLDVTPYLKSGLNALAVEVGVPQPTDLTSTWVDWNPTPQDKNMGIWQNVELKVHGAVTLENPQVVSKVEIPSLASADLTVEFELKNSISGPTTVIVNGQVDGIPLSETIALQASESKTIQWTTAQFPQLHLQNPRLWWPLQMGTPNLSTLTLQVVAGETLSDSRKISFGIRQIDSELTPEGSRLFKINGRPLQIRGGGWSSDLFLRFSRQRMEKELKYVQDLNLNTIRLEGRFEPSEFLDLTDRMGILVMPGWVCCNAWQEPETWPSANYNIAAASIRDQIYQFRSHPSVFVFLYGSDKAPPPAVEDIYVDAFKKYHWPNPILSSAADTTTPRNGRSGVKMNGPYEYTPPAYWFFDKKWGGAWGFNTETSPGPAVPPIESLKEFLPADHLWPIDDVWNFHAGEDSFTTISLFKNALDLRYGESSSVEEFALKSQVMAYDNHRAMFEAFSQNKYHSATGLIQWMLNNSWPSLIWHLYDYYLRPGGSYFGVKEANRPLHLQYSPDQQNILLINQTQQAAENLNAVVELYDLQMNLLWRQVVQSSAAADGSSVVVHLPPLKIPTTTYFLRMVLSSTMTGNDLDHNFYWLSTQAEAFDWKATDWKVTPVLREANLTDLNSLPKIQLNVTSEFDGDGHSGRVTITNPTNHLAFFTHLKAIHTNSQKEILPVLWEDNDFALIPGETRILSVEFPGVEAHRGPLEVTVDGWNISPLTVTAPHHHETR